MAKIAYAMYDPGMMFSEKHIRYLMVDGRWTVFYSAWAFGDDVVIAQEYCALLNERIAVIAAMKCQMEGLVAMKAVYVDCGHLWHPVYCRCRVPLVRPGDGRGMFAVDWSAS